ncbi:unnamed protein product [Zymoseptoria tritici ST99CH_3D1]|nr:unnamed protein product [Zymoseptoria tritici ST99CH_3D1]
MAEPKCAAGCQKSPLPARAAQTARERADPQLKPSAPLPGKSSAISVSGAKKEGGFQWRPAAELILIRKYEDAKAELEQSTAELEKADQRIRALVQANEMLLVEHKKALEQGGAETRKALQDLDEQKTTQEKAKAEFETQLSGKNDLLETRRNRITKQKKEIGRLEQIEQEQAEEYEQLENKIEGLRVEIGDWKSANATVRKWSVETKEESAKLQKAVAAIKERNTVLEDLVSDYREAWQAQRSGKQRSRC